MKKPKHGRQRPDQSNQTHVLLAVDRQNSVLAELKNDDLNKVRYSAYGQRSAELDPVASMAFNGKYREAGTGWYLLGNGYRAYDPVLRRFHSPDSLSPFDSGGLNAYSYCVGDPVNHTDPTGHFALGVLFRAIATNPAQSLGALSMVAGMAVSISGRVVRKSETGTILTAVGAALVAVGAGAILGRAAYSRFRSSRGRRASNASSATTGEPTMRLQDLINLRNTNRIVDDPPPAYSLTYRQSPIPSRTSLPRPETPPPSYPEVLPARRTPPPSRSISISSDSSSDWAYSVDLNEAPIGLGRRRSSIRSS